MSDTRLTDAKPVGGLRRSLALIVAAFIVAVGVVGAVIPETVISFRAGAVSPASLAVEAALKIAVGLALVLAAPHSRAAGTLRCMGAVIAFGGMAVPLVGIDSARERLAWESAHLTFFRFEAALFVLLGAFIASVLVPGPPMNGSRRSETGAD